MRSTADTDMRGRIALVAALTGAFCTVAWAVLPVSPTRGTTVAVEDTSHGYTQARARQVIERRVIGYSVQGRPIRAFRKGNPAASRKVLVLGQIHGDERAGRATARYVRDTLPVDSDVDLWVVPTMNPDGAAAAPV